MTRMINFLDYMVKEARIRAAAPVEHRGSAAERLRLREGGQTRDSVAGCSELICDCWVYGAVERGAGCWHTERQGMIGLQTGAWFIVKPQEKFALLPDAAAGWVLSYFCFDGWRAEELYRYYAGGADAGSGLEPMLWPARHAQLRALIEIGSAYLLDRAGLLFELLVFDRGSRLEPRPAHGKEQQLQAELLALLDDAVYEPIEDERLAGMAKMSVPTLRRKVKKWTGCTLHDWIHRLKMEEAKRLLRGSDAPVKHIAALLRYEDAYYFSRLFKKWTGLSPRQYRTRE
ncbi:helix-turn-helix transcriptional regulator [uncultured Paenibacillus sp.]|uniref:helix-turn-helix transcriptional regulator n=1 Tax=uncultured Paenibacillus sp. TaxID=227322 RepID=UPI0025D2E5EB|nr:AraC family transcriptional regulator [uncultured Paenibacillus sp.]